MTLLSRWSERHRGEPPRIWYHVLLLGLVGLFILDPILEHLKVAHWLLTLAFTAVLVLSILVVARTRLHLSIALGLLIPSVVLLQVFDGPGTTGGVLGLTSAGLLLWFVAGTLAGRVFRHRSVTWESISGAVCVYLLMGLAWSTTYRICEVRLEGAFEGIEISEVSGERADGSDGPESVRQQLTYFSFVTLTTLGYGDITPTHAITRMLATLQAIIGQLYLVIMVARLVAMQVAERSLEEASP